MDPNLVNGYISLLFDNYNNIAEIDSDSVLLDILEQFGWETSLSAYAVYSKMNNAEAFKKMAYKNVHKRIHTLLSLKLIIEEKEDSKTASNKHNAKYYRLSEHGIFLLFLHRLDGLLIRQLDIIKSGTPSINTQTFFHNYNNNLLFESFLYPYFKKKTLFAIGNFLLWNLFHYLADCCHRIKGQLKYHRIKGQLKYHHYDIPVNHIIFCWNKVPGEDSKKLSEFLKELFNLQSVDPSKLMEDPDDRCTRKVETSSASIQMKLDKDRKKVAIMSTARGKWEKFEYDIFEMNSDILVYNQRPFEEYMNVIDTARKQIEQIIYGFVYDLALSVLDSEKSEEYSYYSKTLSEDKRFMAAVEDIYENRHKGFEKGYQMLNRKTWTPYYCK